MRVTKCTPSRCAVNGFLVNVNNNYKNILCALKISVDIEFFIEDDEEENIILFK